MEWEADGAGAHGGNSDNMSGRKIIYQSDAVQVVLRAAKPRRNNLVITFTPAIEKGNEKPKRGFGEYFLSNRGYDVLCFISTENHWWQVPEMESALQAAEAICSNYANISGYGVSMGAYGLLMYSRRLGIDKILAIVPQVTVDPSKPPFEIRWADFAKRINFQNDDLNAGLNASSRVTFVYDPLFQDRKHIDLIDAKIQNTFPVTFMRHAASRYLQRLGILETLVIDLLEDRLDLNSLMRRLRHSRKLDREFWFWLVKTCLDRGRDRWALKFAHDIRSRNDLHLDDLLDLNKTFRKLRDFRGLAECHRRIYQLNLDNSARDAAVSYYLRLWRSNTDIDQVQMIATLESANVSLKSREIRVLLRRLSRRNAQPAA